MYAAKLAPSQTNSDSGYDSASTSGVTAPATISGSIADMAVVKTVAQLFKIPDSSLQKEVDQMRKYCTEKVR